MEGGAVRVSHPSVVYTGGHVLSEYVYRTTKVDTDGGGDTVLRPEETIYRLKTNLTPQRTGVLIVGLGGSNATTLVAGILAKKHNLSWRERDGVHTPNWYGSFLLSSTVKVGTDSTNGSEVFIPCNKLVPMVDPCNLKIGGWDISNMTIGDAMRRAKVVDINLQDQVYPEMQKMSPWPSIFDNKFIASNQNIRADNVLMGTRRQQIDVVRENIRQFKKSNGLDSVIVMWSANTERMCEVTPGVHESSTGLLDAIDSGVSEISPSTLYCVAAILEGCSYINGSPQNTFVPGVVQLAEERGVFIGGDDFKTGQTKFKSALVDVLVSAGIKPKSIVSYNHLGNNDGKNLSSPDQFKSKEVSKSNVVDDMIKSNSILYGPGDHPDHVIVIKYVEAVGDSKRAMDEYTSEIFLNGRNTIAVHNTCEDSLLAAPIIIDLIILTELAERISISTDTGVLSDCKYKRLHHVLSLLGYLTKAPLAKEGTPIVNSLFRQRECILNILRACVGLSPENHMLLEHKVQTEHKKAV